MEEVGFVQHHEGERKGSIGTQNMFMMLACMYLCTKSPSPPLANAICKQCNARFHSARKLGMLLENQNRNVTKECVDQFSES